MDTKEITDPLFDIARDTIALLINFELTRIG